MHWIDCLPQEPPMRLLEEVVDVVAGDRATGRRLAHADDFYFQGHFPGRPIVPAIILIEMLAQTGGIAAAAAAADQTARPGPQLRVAAVGPFKFPAAAGAGSLLEAHARVIGRLGTMFKIEGKVTADGVVVAIGGVTLVG
jgi:3-hydroxyacyl-[acyl-carrier-protein] dehydratase